MGFTTNSCCREASKSQKINDFGPLGVDVGHLGVNIGPLEFDFRLDGEFRLLGFDFRALGVYPEPRGVDIWSLRVNIGPLGVDIGPLGVKIEHLGVDFGPLRV